MMETSLLLKKIGVFVLRATVFAFWAVFLYGWVNQGLNPDPDVNFFVRFVGTFAAPLCVLLAHWLVKGEKQHKDTEQMYQTRIWELENKKSPTPHS